MQQVFGSRKCPDCNQKFDWIGTLNNRVDKGMQKKIIGNKDLQYARFSEGTNKAFKVDVRCSHCNYPIEFDYDDNKKLLL